MKKIAAMALATTMIGSLFGCSTNSIDSVVDKAQVVENLEDTQNSQNSYDNFSNQMKIPYALDLSPEDGADAVERQGDHQNSPYFKHPDFYNMKSTDTLTILSKFKTMQQTSEWSCGVTSALMVLNWYDRLGDWNEENLAALRHSLENTEMEGYPGTTLKQAIDIFERVGGFEYVSTLDYENTGEEFTLETIQNFLKQQVPIMIAWNDWGGHWQVIIGYDTLGTETTQDDVIIVADSYDTTDHNQDGYGIYPAERFYYNFTMYDSFTQQEGGNDTLFLAAKPITEIE